MSTLLDGIEQLGTILFMALT